MGKIVIRDAEPTNNLPIDRVEIVTDSNREYGQKDICLGVPVVIGKNGWEKIVEMDLSADEQAAFNKSADAVRNMNDVLKTL
jgi:malate/lactate dehydrogenase